MKKSSNKLVIVALTVVIAALSAFVAYQATTLKKTTDELNVITAEMEFERQQSIDEFEQLALEYEEFNVKTSNDSLLQMIADEKQKVQQLLQELKTVKATDAHRIAELKKELSTVRGVLQAYVQKFDSLNTVNTSLKKENIKVKQEYEQKARELADKTAEAEELDNKLTMAAILEANDIAIATINTKGKSTTTLRKIANFEIRFKILRNITAERGRKTVYVRVTDSHENLLKDATSSFFEFEGTQLGYSCKKDIEYGGETLPVCIYFPVKDITKDTYTIDIFVDGNLVGTTSFALK